MRDGMTLRIHQELDAYLVLLWCDDPRRKVAGHS